MQKNACKIVHAKGFKVMVTRILKIDKDNESKVIEEAGEVLKSGGLVAFPTETVYGISRCLCYPSCFDNQWGKLWKLGRIREQNAYLYALPQCTGCDAD